MIPTESDVLYLWVVLCIPGVQRDGLQIKPAVQIDRGHDIPLADA
jgi:hypothetical protein